MNQPFNPTNKLVLKPEPKVRTDKTFRVFEKVEVPVTDDQLEEGELVEASILYQDTGKKIIQDKRNQSQIDRQLILNRIRTNNLGAVVAKKDTVDLKKALQPVGKPQIRKLNKPDDQEAGEDEDKPAAESLPLKVEIEKLPDVSDVTEKELEAVILDEVEVPVEIQEKELPIIKKIRRPRKLKVTETGSLPEVQIHNIDLTTAKIRDQLISERLPPPGEKVIVRASSYYMNNREIYVSKLNELFRPYRKDITDDEKSMSCETRSAGVDLDLLTHQKIVRDYLNLYTPYRGLLLYHGLGSGKCMKLGTPILMSDGSIKKVENIQVGDFLMGDDSKPRTVLSLARGRDKMYDIIPTKGEKYTVNQEHILCLRASGFPKMTTKNTFHIQWIENNEFQSCKISYNSDNFEEKRKEAEAFFTTVKNTDNVLEIAVKDFLGLSKKKKALLKGYRVSIEFPEKELPMDPYFFGYKLANETLDNQSIPGLYKCNSRNNRLKLLAGLLDSNGCYTKVGFEFNQKNETLIDDIIYLARSLGFSCYKKTKKEGSVFRLQINGHNVHEIPTKICGNRVFIKKPVKDALVYGINVQYVGEDDYYGFMLDGNCRYVIGDFSVTHNTATSIAIAEGMKSEKKIFVLTPASLKTNFFTEIKRFGDQIYRKNQFWEFVSTDGRPEYIGILAKALSLPQDFVRANGGAWLVNIENEPNFTDKTAEEQLQIDDQLNKMIRSKYTDINYNGLTQAAFNKMTENGARNPFHNSVILIDEAHNFVSRIVNKIKKPTALSYKLYHYLMDATNARVVFMTGTPIINYPNEIGILFNMLRGYIKTWNMTINVKTSSQVNNQTILEAFDKENFRSFDYVEYSGNKLTITRNPFGFINTKKRGVVKGTLRVKKQAGGSEAGLLHNLFMSVGSNKKQSRKRQPSLKGGTGEFDKYNGVKFDETGNLSDDDFQNMVMRILTKNGLEVMKGSVEVHKYKSLPDDSQAFLDTFVDNESVETKNMDLFQRRILGLTSYFRSAQESLLPRFEKTTDNDIFHVVQSEMSDHQFSEYQKIRKSEAEQEKRNRKNKKKAAGKPDNEDMYKISSTYRIFSRSACNFVFPPGTQRPLPSGEEKDADIDESTFNATPFELRQVEDEYLDEEDVEQEEKQQKTSAVEYQKKIKAALDNLQFNPDAPREKEYLLKSELGMCSPKFVKILDNLSAEENRGLHLVYSQFRTIEGIGILKLILEANGYAEFKIRKTGDTWQIEEKETDAGKSRFVLYTGTETAEEKEIIRNIYNSNWDFVPSSIALALRERNENNFLGEVIKIFMITSSGAEGINLKNTRFVHIVEPYWHMVRIEQVIGRARRICSHENLSEDLRTVKVFLYVTVLSDGQKTNEENIELINRDVSRLNENDVFTTDQSLLETASMKDKINRQILKAVKQSAMDCSLYSAKNKDEALVCYNYGVVESNEFGSVPSFENDRGKKEPRLNKREVQWKAEEITFRGVKYALNKNTNEIFDLDSVLQYKDTGVQPELVGNLKKTDTGKFTVVLL